MKIGGFQKLSLIDYPDNLSCIVFTKGCNFRCPYCHNPELVNSKKKGSIRVGSIMDFLRSRIGLLEGVSITGGEPTLQPDLVDFIKAVKEMGFRVKLDTNGTNPLILSNLIEDDLVDYIAMDIKAPLEKYSNIVRVKVDIGKIEESIEIIRNSNREYEFRTTLVKNLLSEDDILSIGNLLEGARVYYLQQFIPGKILNPSIKMKPYSLEEMETIRGNIKGVKTLIR